MRTIGWNANHLGEIFGWVADNVMASSWDFAPIGGEIYQAQRLTSCRDILDLLDRNVAMAPQAIAGVSAARLAQPWSPLRAGSLPRGSAVQSARKPFRV
ncbi:MAG: hypothetical protein ACREJD_06245 [Phycisphaerales bacterium]